MANTAVTDIVSPQIVAAIVNAKLYYKVPLLQTGYVTDARQSAVRDGTNTAVQFPKINSKAVQLGVQANARDGSQVTADAFEIGFDAETIASKIISYANDEKALRMASQMQDANQWLAEDVMKQMRGNIHAALIAKGVSGGQAYDDPVNVITVGGLKKAIASLWGEGAFDGGAPLLIAHSNVVFDLESSEEVTKTGLYGFVNGNGVAMGEVTMVAGIAVMKSDQVSKSGADYQNIIVKPGALELWIDTDLRGDTMRRERSTTYVTDYWFDYATHVAQTNPIGVIKYLVESTLG